MEPRPDQPQWPTPHKPQKQRSAFSTAFGIMMGIFAAFLVAAILFAGCVAALTTGG